MPIDDDLEIVAAHGLASVLLHSALLQALVEKGVFSIQDVAALTARASKAVDESTTMSSMPEMTALAQQMLAGLAQSWAKRAQGN